jgi:hypothetical protein
VPSRLAPQPLQFLVVILAGIAAAMPAIAGTPPLAVAVDLATDCAATGGVRHLDEAVARGLLAFNTPYLFGGRALRTNLTCGACHGSAAPSGIAASLSFRIPPPDIARIAAEGIDVGAFAAQSIPAEFEGPPPPAAILRGLAALGRVMSPRGATPVCAIDAPALIDIELRLIAVEAPAADPDRLVFLIDSTRFALGQMRMAGAAPAAAILAANAGLRAVSDAVDAGGPTPAAALFGALAQSWERMMAQRGEAAFTLAPEREASR